MKRYEEPLSLDVATHWGSPWWHRLGDRLAYEVIFWTAKPVLLDVLIVLAAIAYFARSDLRSWMILCAIGLPVLLSRPLLRLAERWGVAPVDSHVTTCLLRYMEQGRLDPSKFRPLLAASLLEGRRPRLRLFRPALMASDLWREVLSSGSSGWESEALTPSDPIWDRLLGAAVEEEKARRHHGLLDTMVPASPMSSRPRPRL